MKLAILCLALGGCSGRLHLTESYARSTREAFARQAANPNAQAKPPRGLDAQEAAAVVAAYRTQLAGKGVPRTDDTTLVAPQAMPAPTVNGPR